MGVLVVSAFPGTGKTWFYKKWEDSGVVFDSDSSQFPKDGFPANYITAIKAKMEFADIVMVSSHKVVRDALLDAGIRFLLVYPDISLKEEYLKRFVDRGSPAAFVELLSQNWDAWIAELEVQGGCERCVLKSGEFLSDVIQ